MRSHHSHLICVGSFFLTQAPNNEFVLHKKKPTADPIIVEFLRNRDPLFPREIESRFSICGNHVRQTLFQLKRRGLLTRHEDGRYSLTKAGRLYARARRSQAQIKKKKEVSS